MTIVPDIENGKLNGAAVDLITDALQLLQLAVHDTAVDHGWWETDRNFGEMVALMHSELSEALEAYRDHDNPREIRYEYPGVNGTQMVLYTPSFVRGDGTLELGKPVGIASEFADVIIRILDTCQQLGIPLAEAIIRKNEYNRTRPHRHGGRAC